MAKHCNVWLCAALCLLATVAVVSAEGADEAKPKLLVASRPILNTKDVDQKAFETLHSKDEKPMIEIQPAAKVEEPAAPVADDSSSSVKLPPILPFFNSMSPFMKSIIAGADSDAAAPSENSGDQALPVDGADEMMPSRPRGVLTIVFMKAVKPDSEMGDDDDQSKPNDSTSALMEARSNFNLILSRILPQRLSQMFGGPTDPDSKPPMRLIGGDDGDVDRNFVQTQHLLGGDHDIDRFRPFMEDPSASDSDESAFGQGIAGPQIIIRTDQQPGGADLSDDMVRNYPPTNRCVMSFMRLKASAYYRTVVHLLFFSGIILLVLFMIILTIRVYRRRRALRFYNQNMHVATISYEDVPSCPRKTGAAANGNLFLFRLGSLRNSYAQKHAEHCSNEYKSSLLVQSPPAYEQVSTTAKPQEEDAKSLPPYDEVDKTPKSSDV